MVDLLMRSLQEGSEKKGPDISCRYTSTSRTRFKRVKRQALYPSTSRPLMAPFGSAGCTSNSSRRYPTAISWTSYWRCSPTAASLCTSAMVNTAGYGASRTAYPKAQCWLPMLFNISCMTSRLRSPSTDTQTISPSYSLTSAGRQSKRASLRTCQPCPPTSRTGA